MKLKDRKIALVLALMAAGLFIGHSLCAQAPIVGTDNSVKTRIAPDFFGPNTFQVPQMLDGTVSGVLRAEVAGDYIRGRYGKKDDTYDFFVKLQVPLFTDRVNLSVWWAVHEWYDMSPDVMEYRRIPAGVPGKSHTAGTIFLSTDILLLRENARRPGITLRAALRTAAEGGAYESARGYDAAGYFFDVSVGKAFGPFRIALSTGFLCWQTDYGRQNDAVMYGILASYSHRWVDVMAHYGGYWGWERCGDFPNTLRLRCGGGDSQKWPVRPYFEFQHGFIDWRFDQFRLGVCYTWDFLGRKLGK